MPIQKFKLILKSQYVITKNLRHLAFERSDGLPLYFKPGQFITFMFMLDGKIKRRSYSVSTIPGKSSDIEISISYLEGGVASEAFFNAEIGAEFNAMGPAGRLVMQDDGAKRYILVGTGTGIAPYRAMLPDLAKRLDGEPEFSAVILEGVQYRQDLLYGGDFVEFNGQQAKVDYKACFSRDSLDTAKDYEVKGYVQDQFDGLKLNPAKDVVYLCGNPNMIDQAFQYLTEQGFETKNVRREKYISSN